MLSLSIFSWKNLFGFDLPFLPFCGNKIKSKKQKSLIWIFIVFGKQFYFRSFNLGAGEREGEEKGSQELFRQKSLKMESMFFVLLEPHVIHVKYHISRILCDMSHICGIFDISHITHIIWYVTYLWHIWYITYHTYNMIFHRWWDGLGPIHGDEEEVSGARALPAAVLWLIFHSLLNNTIVQKVLFFKHKQPRDVNCLRKRSNTSLS